MLGGKGSICDTYKDYSPAQIQKIFNDKTFDGDKLLMISCYAAEGTVYTAMDLASIIKDPESNPEVAIKLKGLGQNITTWIIKKQYEPMTEHKMKITRRQLRQIIKEELQDQDLFEFDKKRMKCNKKRFLRKGETGYGKQQKVVKACDNDKEKIVKFGSAKMRNNKDKPKNRKSFRARMNCDTPGSKLKARYWACKDW